MARQGINTGSAPDAGDGDSLLIGALKINANFSELYTTLGDGTNITNSIGFAATAGIATYANSSRVVIKDSGSTVGTAGTIDFGNNLTVSAISAGVVTVTASGSGGIAGIDTTGTSYFNQLNVSGVSTLSSLTLSGIITSTKSGDNGATFDATGEAYFIADAGIGYNSFLDLKENGVLKGNIAYSPTNSGALELNSAVSSNVVIATGGGKVGIGTTNPTSALTVQGDVSVSGVTTFGPGLSGNEGDIDFQHNGETRAYWDGSAGTLNFTDNDGVTFGDSDDVRISWDGTDWLFTKSTVAGSIKFVKSTGSENIAVFSNDGPVELYYDNSKKFETLGTGVTVTGTTFTDQLSVSGASTFNSTLNGLYLNNAANVKGTSNIAIGQDALANHTFGNNSIGIGFRALYNASNPNYHNIGIGPYAGYNLTNGVLNTFLGYNSGYDMDGGSGNVIIGSFNGNSYGLDISDADDYIILSANGQSSTQPRLIVDPNGNIGIGTTNPVDGYDLTIGVSNTGIRTTSLRTYGYANINGLIVKGNSRDYTDNVIITQNPSTTFYGNRNVAIGDQSFTTPGAAGENVAIGYYALNVVGNNDGLNTWNGNTAVGAFAGQSVTTTLRNTFIGNNSGRYITTGGENTILGGFDGNQNGLDIRTSSNNIVLSDGAGNIRFYANSSGNVGLGTTNPTVKLEVNGSVRVGIDTSSGVILTSPNGTKYQLFVEDDGTLKTVAV